MQKNLANKKRQNHTHNIKEGFKKHRPRSPNWGAEKQNFRDPEIWLEDLEFRKNGKHIDIFDNSKNPNDAHLVSVSDLKNLEAPELMDLKRKMAFHFANDIEEASLWLRREYLRALEE